MNRRAVNPWSWSLQYGFNQAEIVEAAAKTLYVSGQASVGPDGAPLFEGEFRAQVGQSLDNLEAVLVAAGMSLANVVRLVVYTTDVELMRQNYDLLAARLGAAGVKPAQSLIGVAALALPELKVELEATAVA